MSYLINWQATTVKIGRVLKIVAVTVAVLVLLAFCFRQPLTDWVNSIIYPIEYSAYVEYYAEIYDVDPYLVYAVIKTESGFDPEAVSVDEARGLMQVTEDTFDWISLQLGYTEYVHTDLHDPALGIEYGTFLLGYLIERFEDIEVALTAYHAGMNITAQWLEDEEYSDDGQVLTEIPYDDTDHYVYKATKNYQGYLQAYEED